MSTAQYIIGDAKNIKDIFVKKHLAQPSLIISSPPYFDLLNYNNNENQIGFGQSSYKDYLKIIATIFQDCYDLSTSEATMWLVVDTFKKKKELKLFPFDIVNALKECNSDTWILRDIIIWDKGKNLPWNQKGNFKNQHEYILFFTKSETFKFNIDRVREILELKKWWKSYPERYNPNGKAPSNVWTFNTPIRGWGNSKQNHLCPFPFPLVEKIISLCSDENDCILDPFTGSGSVLAVASKMNRNSLGIDVNTEYKKRYKNEVLKGIEVYWKKRIKEIEEMNTLMANFKDVNQKLRKLKVAQHICSHLNLINNHHFIYFTKDKPKNQVEITVIQNGTIPHINLEDDVLKGLIHQSKISPTIKVVKDSLFIKSHSASSMFKYKFGKFFSYSSLCKISDVLQKEKQIEYMYSDIALKILESN